METVRVYDFDTKKLVTIPATELAPGMIRAHVEGIEGEVFIDASKLQNSPVRHDPFDEGTRRVLQVLYNTIHEVYNVTPQKWEEGFLRDTDPASEIRLWFKIAACYRHFTNGRGLLPEQKMDIFKVIIA
jgi:hypothetical protein